MARDQLKKLVAIEGFDHNEDGEEIVYIRYMSATEMREKKDYEIKDTIGRWSELEDKLKQLAPKQYSPKEISQIVRFVLNRYIQDLQQREDIVFEHSSWEARLEDREPEIGDTMHIGGGTEYNLEDKVYSVNGEKIIVSVTIKGSDDPVVAPDYRFPTNKGTMFVDIVRKGQDGQYENFARCVKDVYEKAGTSVSCYMGDLYYSVNAESGTHPTEYYISKKEEDHYSLEYPSENRFQEFSKDMVKPASIDRLYEVCLSKIRFQFPDKSRQQQKTLTASGIREVGDWPDKRPTNLSFNEIMSYKEIAEHMQRVQQSELTDTAPKKR